MAANNNHPASWEEVDQEISRVANQMPDEYHELVTHLKAKREQRDSIDAYIESRKEQAERLVPGVSKWTLGYQEMLTVLSEFSTDSRNPNNYPPHDIVVHHNFIDDETPAETTYQIIMAVAGFKSDDIQVWLGENTLHVDGSVRDLDDYKPVLQDNQVTQVYAHAGIAKRDFTRQFLITDNMHVKSVVLSGGMLTITIDYIYAHPVFQDFKVVNGDVK
jgi:molecular chaperone IbpA